MTLELLEQRQVILDRIQKKINVSLKFREIEESDMKEKRVQLMGGINKFVNVKERNNKMKTKICSLKTKLSYKGCT